MHFMEFQHELDSSHSWGYAFTRKHVYIINHSLASTLKKLPRISVHWSTKPLCIWWVIYIFGFYVKSRTITFFFFFFCPVFSSWYVWSHHFSYSCAFLSFIGCFFLFLFFFWVIYWWDVWCIYLFHHEFAMLTCLTSSSSSSSSSSMIHSSRFTFCLLPYPLRFIAKLWSGSSCLVTVFSLCTLKSEE